MFSKLINSFLQPKDNQRAFLFVFRVLVPMIALIDIVSLAPDLHLFFGSAPQLGPSELYFIQSPSFKFLDPIYVAIGELNLPDYFYSSLIYVYGTALVFLALGLVTRPAAFCALVLQLFIYRSFANLNYGFDYFMSMSLFYCLIFPTGKVHSIDQLLFGGDKIINIDYKKFLRIHLSIAYFYSGISKVIALGWWDGSSVWRAVASVDNDFYALPPFALLVAGVGTMFLELLHPLFMWSHKTRYISLFAAISMHASIAVMMGLYSFSAIMITWNICSIADFRISKSKQNYEVATA